MELLVALVIILLAIIANIFDEESEELHMKERRGLARMSDEQYLTYLLAMELEVPDYLIEKLRAK